MCSTPSSPLQPQHPPSLRLLPHRRRAGNEVRGNKTRKKKNSEKGLGGGKKAGRYRGGAARRGPLPCPGTAGRRLRAELGERARLGSARLSTAGRGAGSTVPGLKDHGRKVEVPQQPEERRFCPRPLPRPRPPEVSAGGRGAAPRGARGREVGFVGLLGLCFE